MKLDNGREYFCGCNTNINLVMFRAMRDYNARYPNRFVVLFCGRAVEGSVIEDIFRLTDTDRIICLYNKPPYSCHAEYFKDESAYSRYSRRMSRRGLFIYDDSNPEYIELRKKMKQTLIKSYMIRSMAKKEDMESFFFNYGKFLENMEKIRNAYAPNDDSIQR